jgi:hypothetical protein
MFASLLHNARGCLRVVHVESSLDSRSMGNDGLSLCGEKMYPRSAGRRWYRGTMYLGGGVAVLGENVSLYRQWSCPNPFSGFFGGTRVIIVTRVALWCRGKVLDSLTGSSVAMNLQGFPQNVHGFWRYVDEGGRNHEPCVDLFRERVDMGKHKLCSRIIPSRGVFVRWRDLPMGLANANILPSVECEPSSFAFPWRMLPSLCLQLGQVRFR